MSNIAGRLSTANNSGALRSGFRLGAVAIDPGSGTATGPGGSYQLDPKVLDVLVCLALAEGELVSRETLMSEVWGDVIVTDFALSRCIYQLRKQLSLAAQVEQSPIETLPKRGYRLVWPVTTSRSNATGKTGATSPISSLGASLLGLALIVFAVSLFYRFHGPADKQEPTPAAPGHVRLAIFPLEDLSEDQSQNVFARGISQELIHELARLPGLLVMGRNSAFDPDQDNRSELDRAKRLGVDYVLAGSVRTIGNNRRILLHLQKVPEGEQVWSHSFLLEPRTPFNVLQHVTGTVVRLFQFSVDPLHERTSTGSLEAFELFLAAYEAIDIEARRSLLRRAVELDPEFADAWTALASIEVIRVWNDEEAVESAWARCEPYLQLAMEIDPESPWVYVELGRFKRELGEMEEAIKLFRKALELDPGDVWASANLGLVLRSTGRFEEALAIHAKDVALDPLDAMAQVRLGTSYWFVENFSEAQHHYRLAMELNPFNEEIYDSWSGMLGAGLGQHDKALRMMQKKMTLETPPSLRSLSFAASNASVLGLDEMAKMYWQQADQATHKQGSLANQQALYYFGRNEDSKAQTSALQALSEDPGDTGAQLVLTILDMENRRTGAMIKRLKSAYSYLLDADPIVIKSQAEPALLLAYALQTAMQRESSAALLQTIVNQLTPALGREHLWLAAAYAMRGDTEMAMHELQASPPGRVRIRAALLLRDPRFAALHGLPGFQELVKGHLDELERQRASYLLDSGTNDAQLAAQDAIGR